MLSDPKALFGIHSATFINRANGLPYGTLKVLQNSSVNSSAEQIKLNGGSSPYPWKVERGLFESNISLTANEYPAFIFEVLLGKAPTVTGASATGFVSPLSDFNGVVIDAATGIDSIQAKSGSEADLKFSNYVIEVIDATSVNVYAYSDVDFGRGTAVNFLDDSMKINSAPVVVLDAGAVTEIAGTGIEIVGGSGTVDLLAAGEAGDTAAFFSTPISNNGSMKVKVGGTSDTYPEFGLFLVGQKQGDLSMTSLEAYKCSAAGLPLNFNANEFSEWEVTVEMAYDAAENAVYEYSRTEA